MVNPYDAKRWHEITDSSMIKSVGSRGKDLIVEFHSGDFYAYPGLADEVDSLLAAESVGKYFHQQIRHQPCLKLGLEWPDE
jgi:hypothetical protein